MPALTSDPVDVMLAHDAWATRTLLNTCAELTHEQFHHPFDLGLKTLHLTMTHIISVMRRWSDRIAERPLRPMLDAVPGAPSAIGAEARQRTVEELLALLDEAERDAREVIAGVRKQGFDTLLRLEFPDETGRKKRHTFAKGTALVHLCTHSMHHRAQAIAMLRMLGAAPIPDTDPIAWQEVTELPAEIV